MFSSSESENLGWSAWWGIVCLLGLLIWFGRVHTRIELNPWPLGAGKYTNWSTRVLTDWARVVCGSSCVSSFLLIKTQLLNFRKVSLWISIQLIHSFLTSIGFAMLSLILAVVWQMGLKWIGWSPHCPRATVIVSRTVIWTVLGQIHSFGTNRHQAEIQ